MVIRKWWGFWILVVLAHSSTFACTVPSLKVKKSDADGGAAGASGNASAASSGEAGGSKSTNTVRGARGGDTGRGGAPPTQPTSTAPLAEGGMANSSQSTTWTSTGGTSIVSSNTAGGTSPTTQPISICGNGICEMGESSQSCCSDCKCSQGAVCHRGGCATPIAVTAGGFHSCVLMLGGIVECWGSNDFGELGNGAASQFGNPMPGPVSSLTSVAQVVAGPRTNCARLTDGTARCWGDGTKGQLGNGAWVASPLPVPVSRLTDVTDISVGYAFACARTSAGSVKCWGDNKSGQLGNGTYDPSPEPVEVQGITTATQVAAGYDFACARLSDGSVRCWGNNYSGQLGDGTSKTSPVPTNVANLDNATAVVVTDDVLPILSSTPSFVSGTGCALLSTGAVKCWGDNLLGALGNPNVSMQSTRPVDVLNVSGALSITAGYRFVCARLSNSTAKCWGNNVTGQLGAGVDDSSSATPLVVYGLTGASEIAAGAWHSCSMLARGTVMCWGTNTRYELGNDKMQGSNTPVEIAW